MEKSNGKSIKVYNKFLSTKKFLKRDIKETKKFIEEKGIVIGEEDLKDYELELKRQEIENYENLNKNPESYKILKASCSTSEIADQFCETCQIQIANK